jgi:hypothetical protein
MEISGDLRSAAGGIADGTHWIGGRVGPRDRMDGMENRKGKQKV